jgi:hypothetical protein
MKSDFNVADAVMAECAALFATWKNQFTEFVVRFLPGFSRLSLSLSVVQCRSLNNDRHSPVC